MKSRLCAITAVMVVMIWQVPGHAFVDFLFGGSSNRGAVENSTIGDLRSWYTGNPVYQFNPYYSKESNVASPMFPGDAQQPNPAAQPQGGTPGPMPQPTVTYFPPNPGQGQYGPPPQAQATYGQPMQAPGPQYQQPQYQQPEAQYQPQQYQQPQYPPQQYQQPAPAYQGGYQAAGPEYQPQGGMPAVNQYQQPSYQGAPMAPQGSYQ